MRRILLTIEYDGTNYSGWQRQINGMSVQQRLEEALSDACREKVVVTGASRTDAGVHARGQTAHFDTDSQIPPEKYPFVLNTMLPDDIRVQRAREVPSSFHARFLSCGKKYTYRIDNSRHGSALMRATHTHVPVPLCLPDMEEAGMSLLGTHDFAAFQASGGTAKTTVRTITAFEIHRSGDEIEFTIEGNAFLYNMVRIIAGTLIEVGHGKMPASSFLSAFVSLSRLDLGPTAPPQGLELTWVQYPEEAFFNPDSLLWHDASEECAL